MYASAFPSAEESRAFVRKVESVSSDDRPKRMLHQAARLIWLSDRLAEGPARGQAALQILFFLTAAEAVSKLHDQHRADQESRSYVHRFFTDLCETRHRDRLAKAFIAHYKGTDVHGSVFRRLDPLTVCQAIDLLYDVRCDVVHEGRYLSFELAQRSADYYCDVVTPPPQNGPAKFQGITTNLTAEELRQIILEGTVAACRGLLS
jgi:hypothetical protein